MSLRSRSHVKASMVLTRADHLFIHNYIRSLLNNMLRPISKIFRRKDITLTRNRVIRICIQNTLVPPIAGYF